MPVTHEGRTVGALLLRLRESFDQADERLLTAVGGQLAQLEAIAAQSELTNLPTLILGDFNTLSDKKCKETRKFFESRGFRTAFPTGTATWRGAGIRLHADWVFTKGLTVERWGVARPLNVSDHWPIWVEVATPNS